jgi:hypothetical protein
MQCRDALGKLPFLTLKKVNVNATIPVADVLSKPGNLSRLVTRLIGMSLFCLSLFNK